MIRKIRYLLLEVQEYYLRLQKAAWGNSKSIQTYGRLQSSACQPPPARPSERFLPY